VENKQFKKDQVVILPSSQEQHAHLIKRMIEALTDPKTWLFALFSILDNVPNSFLNQHQIIVSLFGFSFLQTTLLVCMNGVIEIVTI